MHYFFALQQWYRQSLRVPIRTFCCHNTWQALETAVEQGEPERGEANTRSSKGEHSSPPDQTVSSLASARTASLALLDALLSMVPGHLTALRCRATTLAGVGRMPDALAQAREAVFVAEGAFRTFRRDQEDRLRTPVVDGDGEVRSTADRHRQPVAAAALAVGMTRRGERRRSDHSIGFMPSSKVAVGVGGLLYTGGGRLDALELAKSLVLCGCIRQKMGRIKQAEDDYRRALVCTNRELNQNVDLRQHGAVDDEGVGESGLRRDITGSAVRGGGLAVGKTRRNMFVKSRKLSGTRLWRKRGPWSEAEKDKPGDSSSHDECTSEEDEGAPPLDDAWLGKRSANDEGKRAGAHSLGHRSVKSSDNYEVLKLESLIHHNLATMHIAAVLTADGRAPFHKVCHFAPRTIPPRLD